MSKDVQQILIRWGKSRAINDANHLDFPHETPFSRLSKSGGWAVKMSSLDDETHGQVDAVVSQLGMADEYRHAVIVMSYVHMWSDAVIGRALSQESKIKHTRHHVRDIRHRAEGWIESRLP